MMDNYEEMEVLIKETKASINANLMKGITDLKRLEDIGVSRVSLGPEMLYYLLDKMHHLAHDLLQYNSQAYFEQNRLPNRLLENLLFH